MSGHGCLLGGVVFCARGVVFCTCGVVGAEPVLGVVLVPLPAELVEPVEPLEEPGAAAAPAMPATAPADASAPATIVAPNIFEMVMFMDLL